jgi:hypothetical protein
MIDVHKNCSNNDINFPRYITNKPLGLDKYAGESQKRLTKAIAEYIITTDNASATNQLSRIIGLEGAWGVGKSNVIKQLEAELTNKYYFFEYDAWGHQEDLQRRSFLETLTTELIANDFLKGEVTSSFLGQQKKKIAWEEKLKDLLAHKIIRKNKTLPKFNAGALFTALSLSLVTVTTFIAERLEANSIITDTLRLTMIAFSPIIIGFLSWRILCIKNKSMRHLEYLLQISKDENIETENYETINEEEPTVAKFNAWMNDISDFIKENNLPRLIIVFDNMDRLPKDKVKELWSSIHTFFAEKEFENIWAIIPFDQEHLSCAFREDYEDEENKSVKLTKYFISKTFPIIYRVPRPVITDYREIFNYFYDEAFGISENKYKDEINLMFRLENPDATVREIITFINELVSLKTIWGSDIEVVYMAVYMLKIDKLLADTVKYILSGEYLYENIWKIVKNDEDLQKNIAALVYSIKPSDAEQISITKYIDNCLKNLQDYNINKYSKSNKYFFKILYDRVHEIDKVNIDNAITALSILDINEFNEDEKMRMDNIWHYLFTQKTDIGISELRFQKPFETLLLNTNKNDQKAIVNFLCNQFQKIELFKEFKGDDYWQAIESLEKFIEENKINTALTLKEININVEAFIDIVYNAKEDYEKFKVKTDPEKLEEYYIKRIPDNLSDAKVAILQYLENNPLKNLQNKIESVIEGNAITDENLGNIFFMYRSIQKKKGKLSHKLTPAQIKALWTKFNGQQDKSGYIDIAAMQFSNGINVDISEKQIKKVAGIMDYYADYGELLINNLTWNTPDLSKVLKFMTENQMGSILSLEKVLPKFLDIKNKINITEDYLFSQLDSLAKDKDSITIDNIETIVPKGLYQFTVKTKNELTIHINKIAVQKLSNINVEELYSQKDNVTTYYYFVIADCLIETEYMEKLPDNMSELAKKILNDIASGAEEIPDDNCLFYKIITRFDGRKLDTVSKDFTKEAEYGRIKGEGSHERKQ